MYHFCRFKAHQFICEGSIEFLCPWHCIALHTQWISPAALLLCYCLSSKLLVSISSCPYYPEYLHKVAKHCHLTVCPLVQVLVTMLNIVGLLNSTSNLPIWQRLIRHLHFFSVFELIPTYAKAIQIPLKPLARKNLSRTFWNLNILHLLPNSFNAITQKRLTNFQFHPKEEKSVSDNCLF